MRPKERTLMLCVALAAASVVAPLPAAIVWGEKVAVDPAGILAPGRYSPEPADNSDEEGVNTSVGSRNLRRSV